MVEKSNTEKPAPQGVTVGGVDAHGAMGEQAEPTNPIPAFIIDEGKRQAEGGAHFYGKPLTDCTREELYGAIVAAWFEVQMIKQGGPDGQQPPPEAA